MGFTVRVFDREVQEALRRFPTASLVAIGNSLRKSAVYGQRRFRENMPVGATGMLRKTTRYRFLNRLTVEVRPTERHAVFVEYGTRPHWTSVKNLERWARFKGLNPYAVQRSIARKGTRKKPFLAKTHRQVEKFAREDMRREMNKVLRRTF